MWKIINILGAIFSFQQLHLSPIDGKLVVDYDINIINAAQSICIRQTTGQGDISRSLNCGQALVDEVRSRGQSQISGFKLRNAQGDIQRERRDRVSFKLLPHLHQPIQQVPYAF